MKIVLARTEIDGRPPRVEDLLIPALVMVTVRPPAAAPAIPQALRSVVYQRPVSHIKHTGSFGQIHYGLRAEREGYDDVLLIDRDEVVSEAGIANVLCHDGDTFVWPDAPALPGITMLLLDRAGLGAHVTLVNAGLSHDGVSGS